MASIYWLIAFIVLIGIEIATMALTTIWFAGGALVAFILALLGASVNVQLVVFLVISFVLLFFTRPLASKYINKNTTRTNVESLVGKQARVTVAIDNTLSTGAAVVDGQEWTARAADDTHTYPVGALVNIQNVKGVKIIVSESKEEV